MKALLCLAVVLAVVYSSQAFRHNPMDFSKESRELGAEEDLVKEVQEIYHAQETREPMLSEGLHGSGEGHEHEKLGANNNRKRRCFWPFYSYYDYYYEPYAMYQPGGYGGGYY